MTQDDVIKLWEEANGWSIKDFQNTLEELQSFAKLIAAKEREACAKECEHTALRISSEWMAHHCAAAIRARGEQA